jgi:DNA-binding winged helix-turn-helix (wHTH) protein
MDGAFGGIAKRGADDDRRTRPVRPSVSTAHKEDEFARLAAEAAKWKEKYFEAQEEITQLKAAAGLTASDLNKCIKLGLTKDQAKVLLVVSAKDVGTRDSIFTLVYGDKLDPPEMKTIDVHMVRIRRFLAPLGVTVETVWGHGYRMDDENKARFRQLMENPPERFFNQRTGKQRVRGYGFAGA